MRGRPLITALALATGAAAARAQAPPPPAAILGFEPGTDSALATWEEIHRYLEAAARTSPFLRLDTLGSTTLGRPFLVVTVTSPDNQRHLGAIRAAQRLLADPRTLATPTEDSLAAVQPAVILISNNIHSTEIASSLLTPLLVHRLVADRSLQMLLDSVVVLLIPSMNPDGLDTTVAWYRRYKGTPYEGGPLPWLYHPYVGHDNNRDWFMVTQVETRLVTRLLYRDWFPLVVYDVHQMGTTGPRFFVPPFSDPVNPNLDPAIVAGINLVGAQMAADLHAADKRGVVQQYTFDLWWHGGFRSTPTRHNMIGILTEAASARLASPITLRPDELREPEVGVNYPRTWGGGTWRIGDILDYELIAATSLVRLAAREREAFIRRFVGAGRRAVAAGERGHPFAYLIPPGQRDPGTAAHLANLLLATGVEVRRATAPFTANGTEHPAGTLVVPLAQPFRAHVKDLIEPQRYPERRSGGPPIRPYDVTGWTLPMSMGVTVETVHRPFTAELAVVDTVVPPPGGLSGHGSWVALRNYTNAEARLVARALAGGAEVIVSTREFVVGGTPFPTGSVVLRGAAAQRIASSVTAREGVGASATAGRPAVAGTWLKGLPRVGLYRGWTANMDEGWTRWVLEQWNVPFTTVTPRAVRKGQLRRHFDVLILPHDSPARLLEGPDRGRLPAPYDEGLAEEGVAALSAFVRSGGMLVTLGAASHFAITHLKLPITNVLADSQGVEASRFNAPGSILAVSRDRGSAESPVTSGFPDSGYVYYGDGAAFEAQEPARVLLRYADDPLRSGYAQRPEMVAGKAALVEVPLGRGRVVLFGFRPQFRGQTHGTFKLLLNAILLGPRARR